jgi:hypothetical protein
MPNLLSRDSVVVGELTVIGAGSTAPAITATNGISYMQTLVETLVNLTYATTISLNPNLGGMYTTTTINATGNATINATTPGVAGQNFTLIVYNDATSGKTITLGTNFRASATLVGTSSKAAAISFYSDGTNWLEISRQTGL